MSFANYLSDLAFPYPENTVYPVYTSSLVRFVPFCSVRRSP
jgi:hypothetical protein